VDVESIFFDAESGAADIARDAVGGVSGRGLDAG
jgi:hypothetical protein